MPIAISATATATTARTPKRLMNAAANGPISPNSSRRTARAKEMSAFAQPNSRCERFEDHAGRPHRARRGEHDEEGDADDDPSVMDAARLRE